MVKHHKSIEFWGIPNLDDGTAAVIVVGSRHVGGSIFVHRRTGGDVVGGVGVNHLRSAGGDEGRLAVARLDDVLVDDHRRGTAAVSAGDKGRLTIRGLRWPTVVAGGHKGRLTIARFRGTAVVAGDKGRLTVARLRWAAVVAGGELRLAVAGLRRVVGVVVAWWGERNKNGLSYEAFRGQENYLLMVKSPSFRSFGLLW